MNTNEGFYRGYFFCNYYLSSIQQGIQTAHCVANMFVEHEIADSINSRWIDEKESTEIKQHKLMDWADHHKVIIVLNGGNNFQLQELYADIEKYANEFILPCSSFQEDEQSLNDTYTCVGVIVPRFVWDSSYLTDDEPTIAFRELIQSAPLAR